MLPAAVRSASASTTLSFSELNTVLVVLLCTLRGRRHQRPRNTRYRAGATPYPNRTFTGWIAPASPGAHKQTLKPGDLLGSGTESGPTPEEAGSLLELTVGGKQPVQLPNGETRTFLEDGDTVILRAWCEKAGAARIGFGECRSTVLPAIPW
jgi:hypothetical protein